MKPPTAKQAEITSTVEWGRAFGVLEPTPHQAERIVRWCRAVIATKEIDVPPPLPSPKELRFPTRDDYQHYDRLVESEQNVTKHHIQELFEALRTAHQYGPHQLPAWGHVKGRDRHARAFVTDQTGPQGGNDWYAFLKRLATAALSKAPHDDAAMDSLPFLRAKRRVWACLLLHNLVQAWDANAATFNLALRVAAAAYCQHALDDSIRRARQAQLYLKGVKAREGKQQERATKRESTDERDATLRVAALKKREEHKGRSWAEIDVEVAKEHSTADKKVNSKTVQRARLGTRRNGKGRRNS